MNNNIKRGMIFLAEIPQTSGSVQWGRRPVIVVSNDKNNMYAPTVNVIPLTSNTGKNNIPVHVTIGRDCGLIKESVALAEQEMTISKDCLTQQVAMCTAEVMNKINRAIMIQNGVELVVDTNSFADKFVSRHKIKNDGFAKLLSLALKSYLNSEILCNV